MDLLLLDLSVESGNDFFLELVFALNFGRLESQSLVSFLLLSIELLLFSQPGCDFAELLAFVLKVLFHQSLSSSELGFEL